MRSISALLLVTLISASLSAQTTEEVIIVEPMEVEPYIIEETIPPSGSHHALPREHWSDVGAWGDFQFGGGWWKSAQSTPRFDEFAIPQLAPRMPLTLRDTPFDGDGRVGGSVRFGSSLAGHPRLGLEGGFMIQYGADQPQYVGGAILGHIPFLPGLLIDAQRHRHRENDDDYDEPDPLGLLFAPNTLLGFQQVRARADLIGTEVNSVARLWQGAHVRLETLGGFRYLRLREDLSVTQSVIPGGSPLPPGLAYVIRDDMWASNNFYGGQVGLRGAAWGEILFAEVSGKLAIGSVENRIGINSALTAPTGQLPYAGGRFGSDRFALVPELTVRFGLHTHDGRGVFYVGYNFLYLSDVVRLNDHLGQVFGPCACGDDQFRLKRTDFWAQLLSVGIGWRY